MGEARRVVVTGMGCVSGLGQGVEATWARLARGEGAIAPFSRSYGEHPGLSFQGPAAAAPLLDLSALEARLGGRALANLDPLSVFAATAAHEALDRAGLLGHASLDTRTAILFGAGSGGNATFEDGFSRIYDRKLGSVHPLTIPKSMLGAPAAQLSMLFGVRGLTFSLSSACASSAHAIGEGMHMIRAGRCDVALVGGGEACLTLGSWLGWAALRTLAPDTCRPFSTGRKGLVLGEGAAMLVLESEAHAQARGAPVLAEMAGLGAASDAHHLTAPHVDGASAAIRAAHLDAGLALEAPALVSSHGTGTILNDRTEAQAMRAVYGEAMAGKTVIATKSAHGHLIGGGGALEFIIGISALQHRLAPPVLNRLGPDPECDLPLALEPTPLDCEALVSNSFAFGGLNAVLVARLPG
ncbi:beta-ketoacyl synthase [Caulobacter sp. S45]|uniref:beta-ketoacyl-[acyl-carrier-protein] synthase family protein n=1 Tax=Caulobacter sp. S45 TaxID=1641861 RepID=UPI001576E8EE|nr:beta-ketoacyl-[acyl-carrier-protein] synthase family protein [Caulobacter sp. S45]